MARLTPHIRPLAFLVGVWAIAGRAPTLLTEPRLWAEEGTRYYPTALTHNWFQSLLQVQHGYYALWPNLAATLAANFAPLSAAPLVTTSFALFAQVVPLALILWGQSHLWPNLPARLLGVTLYLLAPVAGEVWLNSINSQWFFSILAVLILNENAAAPNSVRPWIYDILLVLAGLTGPVTSFLTPLFLWRAWAERQRDFWVRAWLLSACAVLVGLSVLRSTGNGALPVRAPSLSPLSLVESLWTQSVALSLLGHDVALQSYNAIGAWASGLTSIWLVVGLLALGQATFFFVLARLIPPTARRYLLGAFGLVLLWSLAGAILTRTPDLTYPGIGGRYFYAPNVLLLLCVGQMVVWDRIALRQARNWLGVVLVAAALIAGWRNYDWPALAPADWPKWRDEVALYEADHQHALAIWPLGWKMALPAP